MAKQEQKPAGSLARFNFGAMGLALLGIAICVGLLFLQVTQGANSAHNDGAAKQQAQAIAALLDSRYRDMQAVLAQHTASQEVIVALSARESARESGRESAENLDARNALAERIKNAIPFAARVDLVPRGGAKVDLSADVPINFAALDLLRRAESGEFVGPEASAKPSKFIYTAAPVTSSNGLAGVLFVAYSANYLQAPLAGFDASLGLAQIEQSIDNANASVVLEYGDATNALVGVKHPLQAPTWTLIFKSANSGTVTSIIDLLLPIAAALVLTLGGIWYMFNKLATAVKSDAGALADFGKKLFKGQAPSANHFQIDHFQKAARALEAAKEEAPGIPATPRATRPVGKRKPDEPADTQEAEPALTSGDDADSLVDNLDTQEVAVTEEKAAAAAAASAAALLVADATSAEEEESPISEDDFLDIGSEDDDFDITDSANSTGSVLQTDLPTVQEEVQEETEEPPQPTGPATHADIEIDAGIFRAYDIRGIVDTNLTAEVVYWIGRAFAAEARSEGQTKAVVGRDGRLSSPALSQQLVRGLLDSGMDVVDIGQVATPMLYFATHKLNTGTGIMITGSHNPAEYNGLKMMIGGVTLAEERITALHTRLVNSELEAAESPGDSSALVIDTDYMDRILDDVALAKPQKIVVDCGNGVAGGIAPLVLQELGCEVIPLYCEVDGNFPNHHPDPADPKNLKDLVTVVKAEKADLGIAFDGDGDRIGVVTDQGEIIWPDKLMMLFARDIVGRNPGADVIYDVKCSRHLNNLIAEYGGRPIMWKTGHSHIKAKLKETGALLAGEFSGHIAFGERWYGFDDAIYTAARLLEIIGGGSDSITEVFEEFPTTQATPEIQIQTTEADKFKIIEKLAATADFGDGTVTSIDGVRVDYPTGWGLVRASNTSPKLTPRFEADTAEALNEVQNRFREQLAKVHESLKF